MEKVRITPQVGRVLKVLLEDPSEPVYGFDLMQRTGLPSGSLYPIIARLERAGWIAGRKEAIDASAEGRPPRKYYLLTADGARCAHQGLAELSAQLKPPASVPRHGLPQGGWA